MRMLAGAGKVALALLILPLFLAGPAVSQTPPVPTAASSSGFVPFTATFHPNIPNGSLYQWQFNYVAGGAFVPDYISEASSDVNFTYQREGNYLAHLRVYDTDTGLPVDYDVPITVFPPPVPPVVTILGADPHYAGAGVPATFSASAQASPGLTIASYHWEFLGDGVSQISSPAGTSVTATFTYSAIGTYTVKVTAVDTDGLAGFATFTTQVIKPPNVRLSTVSKAYNDYAARTVPFQMEATAVADTGRSIVAYQWDFDGDGIVDLIQQSSASTDIQTFAYPLAQVYVAKVTAIDDVGIPGTATFAVPVYLLLETAPTLSLTPGTPASLTANPHLYPGTSVLGYTWSFGDGTTASTGPAVNTLTHSYGAGHQYVSTVTAAISDGSSATAPVLIIYGGGQVLLDTTPISIASLSLAANLTAPADQMLRVGRQATFSATAYAGSGPNGNAALTQIAWDFDGDGVRDFVDDFTSAKLLQATSTAQYQYAYPGVYTVKVVAGTTYGQALVRTFHVTVTQGTPPVECWMVQPANGRIVHGNHVTLCARGSPGNQIASLTFQYRPTGALPWRSIAKVVPPPATALSACWNTALLPSGSYDLQAVATSIDGSSSTSWAIRPVTVTVNPVMIADEDESADTDGIPQVRVHVVDPSRPDRTEISQDTRIEFPPHSTTATGTNYARCRIERIGADPHPVETRFQGITFVPGLFRRLDLGTESLTAPARVSLYVPTASVQDAVAASGQNRANAKDVDLTIYRFDDVGSHSWVPLFTHVRQPSESLVRASTVSMGDLGVGFSSNTTSRAASGSSGSWSGCGALGLEGLLPLLLLIAGRRPRRR